MERMFSFYLFRNNPNFTNWTFTEKYILIRFLFLVTPCQDLTRWKNRRRSASQELIKKEEERKRMEKRMKEEAVDGNKRKSIKTYKEIVEDK